MTSYLLIALINERQRATGNSWKIRKGFAQMPVCS